MDTLQQALRGAQHSPSPTAGAQLPLLPLRPLLVVGAGGALGSAVLAEALVAGRFLRVLALVAEPVASALRGFEPLHAQALRAATVLPVHAAVIVFERERHSNGRDDAFVQPEPADLLPLARCVLELARHLPAMPPGTRVIAPESLWLWTQHAGGLNAALAQGLPANPSP